jgi:phospholipase C
MRLPDDLQGRLLTRRELMRHFGLAGAGAVLATPALSWALRGAGAGTVARAASTAAAGSDLEAVEHIVFLMMENRSYDHYFGDYPNGRGFSDHPSGSLGVFAQSYPGGSSLVPPEVLLPFHLDSTAGLECTDDLTHDWGPQPALTAL